MQAIGLEGFGSCKRLWQALLINKIVNDPAILLLPNSVQLYTAVSDFSVDKHYNKWNYNYYLFLLRIQQRENWMPKETRSDNKNNKKNINF